MIVYIKRAPGDPDCLHCGVAEFIARWYADRGQDVSAEETIFRLTELIGEIVNASPDRAATATFAVRKLAENIGGRHPDSAPAERHRQ